MARNSKNNNKKGSICSGLSGWEKRYVDNTDKYAGKTKASRREYHEVSNRR